MKILKDKIYLSYKKKKKMETLTDFIVDGLVTDNNKY